MWGVLALLVLAPHAQAPPQEPANRRSIADHVRTQVELVYELASTGGCAGCPLYKLTFRDGSRVDIGCQFCAVSRVTRTIPASTFDALVGEFESIRFFDIPREGAPPGITHTGFEWVAYRDDRRSHLVEDRNRQHAPLDRLEERLIAASGVRDLFTPSLALYERLVGEGWNPAAPDETALAAAVLAGSTESARFLLDRGASPANAIVAAAGAGRVDLLRLLTANARFDFKSRQAATALAWAAMSSAGVETLRFFLDGGTDADAVDSALADTALIWAAQEGRLEKVRFLLSRGARVDVRGRDGRTALAAAARFCRSDIVQVLLQAGASPYVNGRTASRPVPSGMVECAPVYEMIQGRATSSSK